MRICGAGRWALLAIVAVAVLFFFPLPHGSFQEVHGPTDDLRTQQFRVVLFLMVALATFALCARLRMRQSLAEVWPALRSSDQPSSPLLAKISPLRC